MLDEKHNDFGISSEKMTKALIDFARKIPPLSEEDIILIKANPTLTTLQKIRLIKQIRKSMIINL